MSGRVRRRASGLAAVLLLFAACSSEPASGPGAVAWDRDTCERCSMVIGDRRFAAQVRDPNDQRLRRFDDLGCALLWLAEHERSAAAEPGAPRPEIWVRDPTGERWIDGHAAHFAAGFRTPMGYGFGAVLDDPPRSVDLPEVRRRLLAREDERSSADR